MVEQNLDLAAAAGAISLLRTFAIAAGLARRQTCRTSDFVLASPLAGWRSEAMAAGILRGRWPRLLRQEFGIPLVLNGPPDDALPLLPQVPAARLHAFGICPA